MEREEVLVAIRDFGKSLVEYAQYSEFMDDKEIVLEGVKGNGRDLVYASDRLKDNREVVLAAIKQNPMALKSASNRLRGDVDVVAFAVKLDAKVALSVDRSVLKDVDFVFSLLNANMDVYNYLPREVIKKINFLNSKPKIESIKTKKSSDVLSNEEMIYLKSLGKGQKKKQNGKGNKR